VRTFHVPTVSICAHGLSFLSVADLSTQPRLLSCSIGPLAIIAVFATQKLQQMLQNTIMKNLLAGQ